MTLALHGPSEVWQSEFVAGNLPVAVYGLGKMGLPIAAVYADVCGNVTGVDIDESVVARIEDGDNPVDFEPGLSDLVGRCVDEGALTATTDGPAAAADAQVHVVIVPTLVDEANEPDLSALEAVLSDIASGLSPGDLVIIESTLPPGTTETLVRPTLVEVSDLDRAAFGIAVCPERTSSGTALADIRGTHPKIVGGTTPESTHAAAAIYEAIVDNDIVTVADATTAEAVKVFEGLYRDVNIALANELARLADGLGCDVRAAIDAANTQPYCEIHTPGPGVGGHCIPYYPYFVIDRVSDGTPLLETARAVNDGMPDFVVDTFSTGLAARGTPVAEARVLVLGLTYRAGVVETRASPARAICSALREGGATVFATDPLVDAAAFAATDVDLAEVGDLDIDGAVLVTAHDEFAAVDWTAFPDPLVVVDTRDALDLENTPHSVYVVGRGWQ